MKKNYQQPSMNVVTMKTTSILCASDAVKGVGNNAGLGYGGGSGGSARGRESDDWDDDG